MDLLVGGAGDDVLIGDVTRGVSSNMHSADNDFNMADYRDATGPITVTLSAQGSVTGDASVGTDTLIGIDRVFGSDFADTFTADGDVVGNFGLFNEFVGGGGDDVITGNGITRVGYSTADAGVFVDLGAGTAFSIDADDAAGIGTDTFTGGVGSVRGSAFGDTLIGSDGEDSESFRAEGGDDFIDGGGGSNDRADYRNSREAVHVDLSTGIAQDGRGGTDRLVNIESVRGSDFGNDTLIGDAGDNITGWSCGR